MKMSREEMLKALGQLQVMTALAVDAAERVEQLAATIAESITGGKR